MPKLKVVFFCTFAKSNNFFKKSIHCFRNIPRDEEHTTSTGRQVVFIEPLENQEDLESDENSNKGKIYVKKIYPKEKKRSLQLDKF